MTVAAVGLVAVFSALRMASTTADLVRNQDQAQRLAEGYMTALLVEPIRQMGTRKGQDGRFSWEQAIRSAKDPDLAELVVTVQWVQQGRSMSFRLLSLRPVALPGE
jgi:hypothetical protein